MGDYLNGQTDSGSAGTADIYIRREEAVKLLGIGDRQFRTIEHEYRIRSTRQGIEKHYHRGDIEAVRAARSGEPGAVKPATPAVPALPAVPAMLSAAAAEFAQSFSRAIAPPAASPGPPALWISLREAAKVSGLPRWFLLEQIEYGYLPALNLGRNTRAHWRIKRADLERMEAPPRSMGADQ